MDLGIYNIMWFFCILCTKTCLRALSCPFFLLIASYALLTPFTRSHTRLLPYSLTHSYILLHFSSVFCDFCSVVICNYFFGIRLLRLQPELCLYQYQQQGYVPLHTNMSTFALGISSQLAHLFNSDYALHFNTNLLPTVPKHKLC